MNYKFPDQKLLNIPLVEPTGQTHPFNHLAHHRGQLTVYLQLLGATVPAIYGPSADEKF